MTRIVIDIPDDDYEYIKNIKWVIIGRGNCKRLQQNVLNAIRFGTVLSADKENGKKKSWNFIAPGIVVCPVCGAGQHKYFKNYCPNCGEYLGR